MKKKAEKKEKKLSKKQAKAQAAEAALTGAQAQEQQPVSGAKKVTDIISKVFVAIVAVIAVAVMIFTIVSVTTFDRNDRDVFGYRAYIVNTDSMSATDFDAGDLIITKEVDPSTLQEGDIISYISQNSESYGETITHKILEKTEDANGAPGFITYGTTTGSTDATVVTYEYIMGKYQFRIPKAGTFFNFLRTPQGYIVCIFIPFMLLIIYQGVNCVRLFRRYKSEQMAELKEEKAKIQSEREESAKMMAEMMALRAQLEQQASGSVPPAPAAEVVAPAPVAEPTPAPQPAAPQPTPQVAPAPAPVAPTPAPQAAPQQVAAPAPVAPVAEPTPAPAPVAQPEPQPAPQKVAPAPVAAPTPAPQAAPQPAPEAKPAAPTPTVEPAPASSFDSQFADLSASMDAFFEKFMADIQIPEIKLTQDEAADKDKTEE